jgi:hypothetical protein
MDLVILKIREFNNEVFGKLNSLDDLKIKCDGKESSYSQEVDQSSMDILKKYVKFYNFLEELKISSNKYKQISKVALSFLPLIILRLLQAEGIVLVCFVNREFLKILYQYYKVPDDSVSIKSINHGSYLKLEKIRKINLEDLKKFTPLPKRNDAFQSTFVENNRRLARLNMDIIKNDKIRITLHENQFNFLEDSTHNIMTDTNNFFYKWKVIEKQTLVPIYHLKTKYVSESIDTGVKLRFSSDLNDGFLLDTRTTINKQFKNNYAIALEEVYVESKLNDYGINFYLTNRGIIPYDSSINLFDKIREYAKQFDDDNSNNNDNNNLGIESTNKYREIVFLICHKFESLPMAKKLLSRTEYYDFFNDLLSNSVRSDSLDERSIKKLAKRIQLESKNYMYLPRFDIDIEEMRNRLKYFVKDYAYDAENTDLLVGEYKFNINLKPNLYSFNKKWTETPKDYSQNNQNERRDNPNLSEQESAISKIFKGLKSKQINVKDLNSLYLVYMGFKLAN